MTLKNLLIGGVAAFTLGACSGATDDMKDAVTDAANDTKQAAAGAIDKAADMADNTVNATKLAAVLAMQDDATKARYDARNPQETLMFFGIEPGMTVVEALPGGGWYSKILIPYLGDEGHLIGADYALDMWPLFGGFATPEFVENKKTWPETWVAGAQDWRAGSEADISAFAFGNRDASMDGTVDAVLFIRAMHNLSRFENDGLFMTKALADTHALLKPGGIVGVVQHAGPESNSDEWAQGSNGYLKQSNVISAFNAAGFDLVDESDVNKNPRDVPSNTDVVWRLPQSLRGARENPELKAKMEAIGESNRMTLLFKKR
ncbi:class I SAM-dependent methyltransferase [Fretibacter rubidus]|uniref:class I SAM-dependent methyltransferase n=1 Tax=Fretibacter rubidus TaxID=570162 RepID=UPI00352A4A75